MALRGRGENTRLRLLDEAERQFAEAGFNGTSLAGIAAAVGLGNAGVLHHFPSKTKLYKAVLQRISAEMESELDRIARQHQSAAARLRAAVHDQTRRMIHEPQRGRLILRELLDNLGRVERAKSLPLADYVQAFCRLIDAAQAERAAATGAPLLLLAQFLGSLSYALVAQPTFARMSGEPSLQAGQPAWMQAMAAMAEATLLPMAKRPAPALRQVPPTDLDTEAAPRKAGAGRRA